MPMIGRTQSSAFLIAWICISSEFYEGIFCVCKSQYVWNESQYADEHWRLEVGNLIYIQGIQVSADDCFGGVQTYSRQVNLKNDDFDSTYELKNNWKNLAVVIFTTQKNGFVIFRLVSCFKRQSLYRRSTRLRDQENVSFISSSHTPLRNL